MVDFDKNDYCRAEIDGKWGFINRKGNWKIPPNFDDVSDYDNFNYSLAGSESKYGFIDRLGKWKIPPQFDLLGRYDELNYCHAKFESKYGFIDRYGNWIIEPIFKALGYFDKDGYAKAVKDYESGFIDRKGVMQIHPVIEKNFINSEHDLNYFDIGFSEGENSIVSNLFDISLSLFDYNDKYLFNASYLKNSPKGKISPSDYLKTPFAFLEIDPQLSKILYDFEIKNDRKTLIYYHYDSKWGDNIFEIFTQDYTIYLKISGLALIGGKSGTKIFRLFNIEYVFLNNIDSVSNIEFESFLLSKRVRSIEFFKNNISPLFSIYSKLFRKKIIKDLQTLLFKADIEFVSEWPKSSAYQLKPNDGAGIR